MKEVISEGECCGEWNGLRVYDINNTILFWWALFSSCYPGGVTLTWISNASLIGQHNKSLLCWRVQYGQCCVSSVITIFTTGLTRLTTFYSAQLQLFISIPLQLVQHLKDYRVIFFHFFSSEKILLCLSVTLWFGNIWRVTIKNTVVKRLHLSKKLRVDVPWTPTNVCYTKQC